MAGNPKARGPEPPFQKGMTSHSEQALSNAGKEKPNSTTELAQGMFSD